MSLYSTVEVDHSVEADKGSDVDDIMIKQLRINLNQRMSHSSFLFERISLLLFAQMKWSKT